MTHRKTEAAQAEKEKEKERERERERERETECVMEYSTTDLCPDLSTGLLGNTLF